MRQWLLPLILSKDPAKLQRVARRSRNEELRRVYSDHLSAVYAFFSYSVAKHTAEDLTASTFEKVIKHWHRFDPSRAGERTWILFIARNVLTDHWRRQSHRSATSLDEHPVIAERLAAKTDPLAERLAVHGFADWLRDLPQRDRQILALRYGADLSAADIAKAMDLSEGNVHQIVSRTLKKLRTKAEHADTQGND